MSIKDDIAWFKQQFAADIIPALAGTALPFDLICAIAFQETGELWSKMRLTRSRQEVLRLCVGDTLDAPNRSAFPKNKDALIAAPDGQRMFDLAHQLLVEMGDATGIKAYKQAGAKPDKFVHGYGIFQYDLQHFKQDPDYFLEHRWTSIDACVGKMMTELKGAVGQLGLSGQSPLSDMQLAFVAIVYNTGFGNFKASKGLKQGHEDGGVFYGENIDRYLQIARTVPTPGAAVTSTAAASVTTIAAPQATAGISPVAMALAEFNQFHGINEGHQPLRSRIADYYEAGGGSRSLDPTLKKNAWSAAFVSFCMKTSGVTAAQFAFNLSHSVYIKAAIANQDAGRGVFRAHRINEYAPRPGDLIHVNRGDDPPKSYDDARIETGYPSHCAIVVDFEIRGGVRHAVTIGGNESNSVGKTLYPLDANGLVDQSAIRARLICVVENRLASGAADGPMPLGLYVVNVRGDLKLRGGPGVEFAAIKSLQNGDKLNVLEFDDVTDGRWALVDLEGDGVKDGFVFAKFIEPVVA
jgi:hypothetical protein